MCPMCVRLPSCTLLCVLLFIFSCITLAVEARGENALRINTDLMAGVVGGESARVLSGDIEPSKKNSLQSPATPPVQPTQAAGTTLQLNSTELLQQRALTHICTREETYVEQLKVPTMQPVRVRTSQWCLEFPPRCSNYKTEIREVVRVENITKTRTIRFCCTGYEGNISINDTVCKPVCRGGCGRGYCQTPDVCSCEAGYTGKHCTQRCDHDRWGMECRNMCQCQNGAVCDNKTGLCHCTTGWTGELCEEPCPFGTYGVMCRKNCECDGGRCHAQTGACKIVDNITPNATHVMIETLNSTIANITHNLDRIAQKIVHIAPSITPNTDSALSVLEMTTIKTLPEVIVIKQDDSQHVPKIIVHGPHAGLLGNIHTASGKTPDVIHVITSGANHDIAHDENLDLAGFTGVSAGSAAAGQDHKPITQDNTKSKDVEHEANLLTLLLIILLIIMIAIAASFLYVYRRYHWQKQRVAAVLAAHSVSTATAAAVNTNPAATSNFNTEVGLSECGLSKSYLKPLPDLPAFTQGVRNKIEEPELYDSPSNNSSVKTPSYTYARKESLYSVVTPKSRKGSQESHLYDEIPYPTPLALQPYPELTTHTPQLQQQQQKNVYVPHQPMVPHHVSHLVIQPPTNKFLQVPTLIHTARRVAHL